MNCVLSGVADELGQDAWTAVNTSVSRREAVHRPGSISPSNISPSSIPLQRVVTSSSESDTFAAQRAELHDEPEDIVLPSSSPNTSSIFVATKESTQEGSLEAEGNEIWDGYESPPPRDARIAAMRNERRYRLLLQHNFHSNRKSTLHFPECQVISHCTQ
jgi:hypothetical protein